MSRIKTQTISYIIVSVIILFGAFYGGILYANSAKLSVEKVYGVENKDPMVSTNADFEPFWKVWNMIKEKSPDAKSVSDQDLVYGAIQGLMGSLDDPYSVFFPPKESKLFNESIAGEFGGVGMEVGIKDNVPTVIAPIKGTPAYTAGIKSGDKIIKIDEKDTDNMTIDVAISLIRGEKGTAVKLTIYRDGEKEPLEFKIIRDTIVIPTMDSELRKDGIFVIRVYNFSANVNKLFQAALQEFVKSKSNKLIVDVRGNPGGYLSSAINLSSWFLPSGKTVVIEDFGDKADQKIHRSRGSNLLNYKFKTIVLVDEGSASASEIFAGALKDNGKATLVGEKTYGKGSVQELIQITKDTSIKITIAKWLTPNGISISKAGITPDFIVPVTEEDLKAKRDPQMEKAVEILKK